MKHKMINKKSIVLAFLMICTSVSFARTHRGDTLFFSYDESKAELTMRVTRLGTGQYAFFRADQNNFSSWLYFEGTKAKCVGGDYQDGTYITTRDPYTFRGVDHFDSLECASMVVKFYELTEKDTFFVVSVEYIHNTDTAVAAETLMAEESTSKGWIIPAIVAVVVLVAAVLVIVIMRNKKKKKEQAARPHTKTDSLEVVEVVENKQIKGLDYIKSNKQAYYHVDLCKDFADTAVHDVYIHYSAVKKMYDFFKRSLESGEVTNETGCYFVGCWEYASSDHKTYNISLEDIVEPGDDLEPGEFSFNFGLKIGVKLNAAIEKLSHDTGRDYVHTVWMHSHPGLGLFLSSHDLLVQRQLAYSDAKSRLVAFVVDTNTPNLDLAIFSAKNDGSMNNKEGLTRLYSLEELYDWCRKAHAAGDNTHDATQQAILPPPVDLDKYHALQVNHQGNIRTLNVYLGSSVINAIDDILYEYEGKHTLAGYLFGSHDDHGNIVVNECHPCKDYSVPPTDHLGLFIVDDTKDFASLKSKYLTSTKAICAFIGCGGDQLVILTRNSSSQPFPSLSDAATCSMKPMKEWLRRRRVYK